MSAPSPDLARIERALGLMAERLSAVRRANVARWAGKLHPEASILALRQALEAAEAAITSARRTAATQATALGLLEGQVSSVEARAKQGTNPTTTLKPPGIGSPPLSQTGTQALAPLGTQAFKPSTPGQAPAGTQAFKPGAPSPGPGRMATPKPGSQAPRQGGVAPAQTGAAGGLKAWFSKLSAPATEAKASPQGPPEHPQRQAIRKAWKLAAEVLAFVSPRLNLVAVALASAGLPGRPKAWPQVEAAIPAEGAKAGIPPEGLGWASPLAALFLEHPEATRRSHGAVVQWEACKGHHQQAESLGPQLKATPAHLLPPQAQIFDLPAYRASIHPISHLHLTFRGLPHLAGLFPPPES